jgi:hypothetical protein
VYTALSQACCVVQHDACDEEGLDPARSLLLGQQTRMPGLSSAVHSAYTARGNCEAYFEPGRCSWCGSALLPVPYFTVSLCIAFTHICQVLLYNCYIWGCVLHTCQPGRQACMQLWSVLFRSGCCVSPTYIMHKCTRAAKKFGSGRELTADHYYSLLFSSIPAPRVFRTAQLCCCALCWFIQVLSAPIC